MFVARRSNHRAEFGCRGDCSRSGVVRSSPLVSPALSHTGNASHAAYAAPSARARGEEVPRRGANRDENVLIRVSNVTAWVIIIQKKRKYSMAAGN